MNLWGFKVCKFDMKSKLMVSAFSAVLQDLCYYFQKIKIIYFLWFAIFSTCKIE